VSADAAGPPALLARLTRRPWVLVWLLGLVALPFIWLYADPYTGAAQRFLNSRLDLMMLLGMAGRFGKFGPQAAMLVMFALWAWTRAGRRVAQRWLALSLLCLLTTAIAVNVTKVIVRRERPVFEQNAAPDVSFARGVTSGQNMSFPSGDAGSVFALAMATLLFAPRAGRLVFVLGFLVSAARLQAGMHHFADVWGALLMATAVSSWVIGWWQRKVLSAAGASHADGRGGNT
jgi:membrane-associated phospholipid phosphatase